MLTYKKASLLILIALFTIVTNQNISQAQTFRIVTINTIAGAINGSALGVATMALQNKSKLDYYPARFGVGMGTILGLGIGFYDLSQSTSDFGYYVDGYFSTANSSSTIILLDTFYGAATGLIVGTAISLMTNKPVLRGIQFGTGTGAWIGFAFGLFDAFILSSTGSYDAFYNQYSSNNSTQNTGFIGITGNDNTYSVGFLNPVILNTIITTDRGGFTSHSCFGIELARISIAL